MPIFMREEMRRDGGEELACINSRSDARFAQDCFFAPRAGIIRGPMSKSDRLARILESPRLDRLVPRLQPQLLHALVQRRGLEDCADIVALATPEQLARVFDLDLWRSAHAGGDEALDADRFGVWLEVLMESGASVAAAKLMGVDIEVIVAAIAQHVRVFDGAAVARAGFEIGGYLIEPKVSAAWDALSTLLLHIHVEHHDYFNQVMAGCRRLSNDGFELDGLHDLLGDAEQTLFDVAGDRADRREREGYLSPAQARAFLQLARQRRDDVAGARNPIAMAYFRAIDSGPGLVRAKEDAQAERAQQELAFLANALMAGCSIQGRPFTAAEASRAAAATWKLGAENAPEAEHDVVRAFEVGWRILHLDVATAAVNALLAVLPGVRDAREALDLVMTHDMTAWATLCGLMDECPVIHAAMHAHGCHTVDASAFEFISSNAQVASVRDFLDALPARLS